MIAPSAPAAAPPPRKPFYRQLYVQVLAAILLGGLLGYFYPEQGASLKWLGDAFIKLVKMIITPVIFLTITTGIAGMRDLNKDGVIEPYEDWHNPVAVRVADGVSVKVALDVAVRVAVSVAVAVGVGVSVRVTLGAWEATATASNNYRVVAHRNP